MMSCFIFYKDVQIICFDARIQRLGYSLEITSVAGIIKPPCSNGQTIIVIPDLPISMRGQEKNGDREIPGRYRGN